MEVKKETTVETHICRDRAFSAYRNGYSILAVTQTRVQKLSFAVVMDGLSEGRFNGVGRKMRLARRNLLANAIAIEI